MSPVLGRDARSGILSSAEVQRCVALVVEVLG